jgi:hypothetical protein
LPFLELLFILEVESGYLNFIESKLIFLYNLSSKKMKTNIFPVGMLSGISIISLWTFPSFAVSLSVSDLFLEIENFNRPSLGAIATGDNQIINIAGDGISETILSGSAFFTSNALETFGQIEFTNQTLGFGSNFVGRADIQASLSGLFSVPANQSLSFDFSILRQLSNSQNGSQLNTVSGASAINFFMWEQSLTDLDNNSGIFHRELDILNQINTSSSETIPENYSHFFREDNITINSYIENIISSDQEESITTFLTGSFHWIAPRDTMIFLGVSARACTYSSNQARTCLIISEPRPHPIIFLIFVPLFLLLRSIK